MTPGGTRACATKSRGCVWGIRAALGWLVVLASAVGPALAQTPCIDEPGFLGLRCRVEEIQTTLSALDARLAKPLDRLRLDLARAETRCRGGRRNGGYAAARGAKVIERMRRDLAGAVGAGAIDARAAQDIDRLLDLVAALERATLARLVRHPCPQLFEVLRPLGGARYTNEDVLFLVRWTPGTGSSSPIFRLDGPGGIVAVTPTDVSATHAWGSFRCAAPGPHVFGVRAEVAGLVDAQKVTVHCGAAAELAIGASVEALVTYDHASSVVRLTPVRPLRSGATYAVVATDDVRTPAGRRLRASRPFRDATGLVAGRRRQTLGPVFATDAQDPRNPFPSQRLIEADGSIAIPDGFTARALPADARLDGVRAFLRGLDGLTGEHDGFGPHVTPLVSFDRPVDLDTATPDHLFIVEIHAPDGVSPEIAAVLRALERDRGIRRRRVSVASVFRVADFAGVMMRIRDQIATRAAAAPPAADFTDPDPVDNRVFGIHRVGDGPFAALFGGTPPASVGTVARGRFRSPEYRERDAAGRLRIPEHFLDGSVTPPQVPIEFLLATPLGPPPAGGFPTVIAQHGFGGDHRFVLEHAAELSAAGLAVIGISAPEHGPRGAFLDFFVFDDFNAFGENWRQASVDLFQLAQLVRHGVDLDGDGASDVRGTALGYFGASMGGVTGSVFAAIEPLVTAAVLNVPGGRLAQFAGSISSLAVPFLERFAVVAGIASRTCGGAPAAMACTGDTDCTGGATCVFSDDFVALLDAALPNFQAQLDSGDGSAYAHLFRLDPPGGRPKAVLVQEGIGDTIVANPLTEALARAIGLAANTPDRAPGGVAGLWRFPPPAGHAIRTLPEVRSQAVTFLASEGTVLAAP